MWGGTAWSALTTGTNEMSVGVAAMPNGNLIAGGFVTTAGGVTVKPIGRWNGTH